MIRRRVLEKTLVLCDSGGYQIATGAGKRKPEGDDHYETIRHDTLEWMEHIGDAGMHLDVPTLAIDKNQREDFAACLHETVENARYFSTQRSPKGSFRLLTPLQGRSEAEAQHWYAAVAQYHDRERDAWAIAGGVKEMKLLLPRISALIRDKCLGDWIHVLGAGNLTDIVVLSALQNSLVAMGHDVRITCDASNPFSMLQYHQRYTQASIRVTDQQFTLKSTPINPDKVATAEDAFLSVHWMLTGIYVAHAAAVGKSLPQKVAEKIKLVEDWSGQQLKPTGWLNTLSFS
jgi:hypothetical protein